MGLYRQHQFWKTPFKTYFQENTSCHFKDYTRKPSRCFPMHWENLHCLRWFPLWRTFKSQRTCPWQRFLHLWVTTSPLRVFLLLCNSPFEDLHIDEGAALKISTLLGREQPLQKSSHGGRSTPKIMCINRVLPSQKQLRCCLHLLRCNVLS